MEFVTLENDFYKNRIEELFKEGIEKYNSMGLDGNTFVANLAENMNKVYKLSSKEKGVLYAYAVKKLEQSAYNTNTDHTEPLRILKKINKLEDEKVAEILEKFRGASRYSVQIYIDGLKKEL